MCSGVIVAIGGQPSGLTSLLLPWVPGVRLKLSSLCGRHFSVLSHCPSGIFLSCIPSICSLAAHVPGTAGFQKEWESRGLAMPLQGPKGEQSPSSHRCPWTQGSLVLTLPPPSLTVHGISWERGRQSHIRVQSTTLLLSAHALRLPVSTERALSGRW